MNNGSRTSNSFLRNENESIPKKQAKSYEIDLGQNVFNTIKFNNINIIKEWTI